MQHGQRGKQRKTSIGTVQSNGSQNIIKINYLINQFQYKQSFIKMLTLKTLIYVTYKPTNIAWRQVASLFK